MFRSSKILLLTTLFSLVWFSAYSQGRDLQFGAHVGNLGWGVDAGLRRHAIVHGSTSDQPSGFQLQQNRGRHLL